MCCKFIYMAVLAFTVFAAFCGKTNGDKADVIISNNMIHALDEPISELKKELVSGIDFQNGGQADNQSEFEKVLEQIKVIESYHIPLMKANSYLLNSFQFYVLGDVVNATEALKNTRNQLVMIRTINVLKEVKKLNNILQSIEELEKEIRFSKTLSRKYLIISQQMESLIETKNNQTKEEMQDES